MKIYINNLNLDLLKDISGLFKEYLVNTKTYIRLYTSEGIYNIEDDNIYFLEQIDKSIKKYENYYEKYSLIVDKSYFNKKQINSIHGDIHEPIKITKNVYELNKKSSIKLVIKFSNENKKMIPNDIYFYSEKDIDITNVLIKKEIIEFLSVLN